VGAFDWISCARGTIIITGLTTGPEVRLSLLPMLGDQITVTGSIMGTLQDMKRMISLIIETGTKPEIGQILPMERAREAFQAMWEGETHGKTVFSR
jgi:D-arabinose 1-dehydrogenase-like Zn-dependent alcohol dehydrogenase